MKIQEIIQNIEKLNAAIDQKEQQKQDIEVKKQKLLAQKQEVLSTLYQFNTFNVDAIGRAIANLLTVVDKQPYAYYTAYRHISVPEYDMFGKYDGDREFNIPIKLILPKKYKEEVFYNDEFLKVPLFIVLDANTRGYLRENDLEKSIKLYNGIVFVLNEITFNNIPNDYLNIIEEFVNAIRNYRFEKNEPKITEAEINEILDNYTSQYEFKNVSYIKKIIKK
ncbi:MAG: hypothetical protein IKF01_01920 [Bacilli bacterium]|nr:hypothetical protein [Bacilli bacterium]